METLAPTQAPETTPTVLDKIVDNLKSASQETLEKFLALFQNNAETVVVTETEAMADIATETIENGVESAVEQSAVEAMAEATPITETLEAAEELTVEAEPTTEELQNAISTEPSGNAAIDVLLSEEENEPTLMNLEEPKSADFEIRLDEIYSIRVVANEVVSSIEELQNEVAMLREKVESMFTQEEMEAKVKEMVTAALRERFV